MILENAYTLFTSQLIQYGKGELAKKFPRDFEVYMCALELVDEENDPVDYFLFPVMPRNINKTETEATSIQTSFSGITVFNKQGFTPDELTIEGDFGRSFKLLSDDIDGYSKAVAGLSIRDGYYTSDNINSGVIDKKMEFPFSVKTGFGCIKILQSIIHKAKAYGQSGVSYRLYFYNQALGESYLVVPTKNPLILSQNEQSSNMIWQYQLNLTIIADLNDITDKKKSKKSLQFSFSQEQLLGGVSGVKTLAKQYTGLVMSVVR